MERTTSFVAGAGSAAETFGSVEAVVWLGLAFVAVIGVALFLWRSAGLHRRCADYFSTVEQMLGEPGEHR